MQASRERIGYDDPHDAANANPDRCSNAEPVAIAPTVCQLGPKPMPRGRPSTCEACPKGKQFKAKCTPESGCPPGYECFAEIDPDEGVQTGSTCRSTAKCP